MPRTIWSGAISFGLVTVPIHVVSVTEDHSVRFRQYHVEDMGRVRVRKVCELEDQPGVPRPPPVASFGSGRTHASTECRITQKLVLINKVRNSGKRA